MSVLKSSHVDLLLKAEIIYELQYRGLQVNPQEGASELRKKLRSVLKLGVGANLKNIASCITIKDEVCAIELALNQLQQHLTEVEESKRVIDILRGKVKIEHYAFRITNLELFKMGEEDKKKVAQLKKELEECQEMLVNMEYDKELEYKISHQLEESVREEECLAEVMTEKLNVSGSASNKQVTESVPSSTNGFMYAKLPNPVQRILDQNKVCDGMKAHELLEFFKLMYRLKDESDLMDRQVIEMCLGSATGPLYKKLLESKKENCNVEKTHGLLLRYFIPVALRDSLKAELVNRPQRVYEPMSTYIEEVKLFSKLLQCGYCEQDIVEIICIGLTVECRQRLSMSRPPSTLADLDMLVMQERTVAYSDYRRGNSLIRSSPQKNVNNNTKTCYNCNKIGHISKECRQPRNRRANQNCEVPKNV